MIIQFVLARILTSKHSLTNLRNYIDTKGQRTYKIVKRQTNPFKSIQHVRNKENPEGGADKSKGRCNYIQTAV
jgi:hypothetical protein